MRAFPSCIASCAGALLLGLATAKAEDASPWDGGSQASLRLIAGAATGAAPQGAHRAGIEIKLKPGWKTYWRYPGEAGIPPRFDFTGSQNVKAIHVGWPAPARFTEGGVTSIGYKGNVIFPLRVEAAQAGAPVRLRAKVDYAICDSICMPVEGKAELTLNLGPSPHDEALKAGEARVPKGVALGEEGPLTITSVKEDAGPPRRVLADVKASAADLDLFAEGPNEGWSLPLPAKVAGAPAGAQRFAFELDGVPKDTALKGAALTLTATAGEVAVETTIHLD